MSSTRLIALLALAFIVAGCDDTVKSAYPTKSDASKDDLFKRGWLPEIIPDSSRDLVVENDLDLDISDGSFAFDSTDYEAFIGQMTRVPGKDEGGTEAYQFEEWFFWIDDSRERCRYRFELTR
ncbi:MAG: hypothetical protein O3A92_00130 [Verrucomicrobia bacterium]|nr:hypothetical protein [Verrucomicrobiota bacterium]